MSRHFFHCMVAALALAVPAGPTRAGDCALALLLAVDVSGSVDPGEYRTQMQGLADGLRDGAVSEALVAGGAAVLVTQWTGASRQAVVVPWTRIESFDGLDALAAEIEAAPRHWRSFSTAIGEALLHARAQFADAPDCARRVIDISGDGVSNEGLAPGRTHRVLANDRITVNALVIEGAEPGLAGYFRDNVITGPGSFAIRANGYAEYAERMRRKLRREVSKQVSGRASRGLGKNL